MCAPFASICQAQREAEARLKSELRRNDQKHREALAQMQQTHRDALQKKDEATETEQKQLDAANMRAKREFERSIVCQMHCVLSEIFLRF